MVRGAQPRLVAARPRRRTAACRRWCATSTASTATRRRCTPRDCEGEGFEWLIADDSANSVFAWLRKAPGASPVAVISNFTPVPRAGYGVPLPHAGRWREILNTDAAVYGGSGMGNMGGVDARRRASTAPAPS